MKVAATLFIIFMASAHMASAMDLQSQMAALMSVKTQAHDAVDDALKVLHDLIAAQNDEQSKHDASYGREKTRLENTLAQLEKERAAQRKRCDDCAAHVKFIEDEIRDTNNHLDWIANRVSTLHQQRIDLHNARCQANHVFIQSLREHRDALEVIEFLKKDLANYQDKLNNGTALAELSSTFDKLKAYAFLFKSE